MYRLFMKTKHLPLLLTVTFGRVYAHFDRFLQSTHKFGTISTLIYTQIFLNMLKLD